MTSVYIIIGILVLTILCLFLKAIMDSGSQEDDKWLGDRQYEENIGVTIKETTTSEAYQKG